MSLKPCTKCKEDKPPTDFYTNKRKQDGLDSWCKACIIKATAANAKKNRSRYAGYSKAWAKRNPEKVAATHKAYVAANRESIRAYKRDYQPKAYRQSLKTKYGITPEQFDALFVSQNNCCALCGCPCTDGGRSVHVDHDHSCCPGVTSCGQCVRGLLCQSCNCGLGNFKDCSTTLTKAVAYLQRHSLVLN